MTTPNLSRCPRRLIHLTIPVTPELVSQIDHLALQEGEHNRSALMRRLLSEGLRRYSVLQVTEGRTNE